MLNKDLVSLNKDIESFCMDNNFDDMWLSSNEYYIKNTEIFGTDCDLNIVYYNNKIKSNMYNNREFFSSCKTTNFTYAELDVIKALLCLDNIRIDDIISEECKRGINLLYNNNFRLVYDFGSIQLMKGCHMYDMGSTPNYIKNILEHTKLLISNKNINFIN